jgi:uncharacterized lipoprotein YajG
MKTLCIVKTLGLTAALAAVLLIGGCSQQTPVATDQQAAPPAPAKQGAPTLSGAHAPSVNPGLNADARIGSASK